MLNWAIALVLAALIASLVGFVAGASLAATKIIFALALLAFLVFAVVEVNRRGIP
jgi:uncharacterized membrane protein YtjA (UPF0391 family)